MERQQVYVAAADGERELAEELALPLAAEGYVVLHNGTVRVGDSIIAAATEALKRNTPVVLCATKEAAGSTWTNQLVNAARVGGLPVFVVQMHRDAYVDHLAVGTEVARYCDDPAQAMARLIAALHDKFPPTLPPPPPEPVSPGVTVAGGQYLDEPSGIAEFDHLLLHEFRSGMREEVQAEYPPALPARHFLELAGLWAQGSLTRTGAVLFARHPSPGQASYAVKCVRYHGTDRSASRDAVTLEGSVLTQIDGAWEFISAHTVRGELPSSSSAKAEPYHPYPQIAVREIIANAVVHRDFSRLDSCVHVRVFADRLEVSSPGTWYGESPAGDTPVELGTLESHSRKRNYQLARMLTWSRYVEGEGSGIPTAVQACREKGNAQPLVLQEEGFVTVRLLPPAEPARPEPSHITIGGHSSVTIVQPAPRQPAPWPHQVGVVPRQAFSYQGRDESAQLARLLDDHDGVALVGLGGVGKTQLAAEYARGSQGRGDLDVLVWVDARSRAGIVAGFAQATAELIPSEVEEAEVSARMFLAWLEAKGTKPPCRWLVVLDDLLDPADLSNLWPPSSPTGRTLVTTRRRYGVLSQTGLLVHPVHEYHTSEAMSYLSTRLPHEPGADLIVLAAALGNLPGALAQAADHLAETGRTCADLLEDISRPGTPLPWLTFTPAD
ncbi:hypothetical protein CFP65_6099 [Kitasatospora sp. MMS16-BH015]|uniref:ATP-binding protein n=1 Tax=Kitasatospora sp. MMS16-BH015 TaxID=2018025 RepID=UPI000CA0EE1C|nr:ATP-binding protein [Kitasatospora sp. MMS16-BH015]AUG80768.1 hypothetical protein CFP65_6099 [Kitasatospora sp. MMS16-BH015]